MTVSTSTTDDSDDSGRGSPVGARRRQLRVGIVSRGVMLLVADVAALVIVCALCDMAWRTNDGLAFAVVFGGVALLNNMIAGEYEPRFGYWRTHLLSALAVCAAIAATAAGLVAALASWHVPRPWFAACVLGVPLVEVALRQVVDRVGRGGRFAQPVLIYGVGARAARLRAFIEANPAWGFSVAGHVRPPPGADDNSAIEDHDIDGDPERVVSATDVLSTSDDAAGDAANAPVPASAIVGDMAQLPALCRRPGPSMVLVARRATLGEAEQRALLACQQAGVAVARERWFVETFARAVPVDWIDAGDVLAATEARGGGRIFDLCKRAFDVATALVGLAGLALIAPPLALAIVVTMRRPVFYRQQRVGLDGRRITIVKFRTMVRDAEPRGAQWAVRGDDRATRLGQLLRLLRVDELPQFVNVLRGEMSLIGPRPERPEFVRVLEERLPFYGQRHVVRPGITGWAQVNFRRGHSVMDSKRKLEFDLYYVRHRGLLLEMAILLRTIAVCLAGRLIRRGQAWSDRGSELDDPSYEADGAQVLADAINPGESTPLSIAAKL